VEISDDDEMNGGHVNGAFDGDVSQFDLGSPMVEDPSPPPENLSPWMEGPVPPENNLGGNVTRQLAGSPPARVAGAQGPDLLPSSPVLGRPMGTQYTSLTRLRPEQPR
jgi:hypothetical protein